MCFVTKKVNSERPGYGPTQCGTVFCACNAFHMWIELEYKHFVLYLCYANVDHMQYEAFVLYTKQTHYSKTMKQLCGLTIVLVGYACVYTTSTAYVTIAEGNPTGTLILTKMARSSFDCIAECMALQSEMFEYVAPLCSCYDAPGAAFVFYGTMQVTT